MPKTNDTILALDPGMRDLGFAVLSGAELRAHGVLALGNVRPSRRLGLVDESLSRIIRGYEPDWLVFEIIPNRHLDRLAGLPALKKLLLNMASEFRLQLQVYSARSVRKLVVGDGWAGKRKVAERVADLFPALRVYLTQDRKWKEAHFHNMFDAVALALRHQLELKQPSRSR